MKTKTSSNHPVGNPRDKVRKLQLKLWVNAKQCKERRYHALYDRIYSWPVLNEAWRRVRINRGSCGVDGQTLNDIETAGVELFLKEVQDTLKEKRYRPQAVRRVMIPKRSGNGQRPLGIPAVRDRLVQMAAGLVLTPIFEADFQDCSFGYRPKRSAQDALERIRVLANQGYNYVVDADIKDYFNSIDHDLVKELVARRVSDRRVQKLIRQWLECGVLEEGRQSKMLVGTPQGGVISPLLSNIVLNEMDKQWQNNLALGKLTRYCDDFVIQCRTQGQAVAVLKKAGAYLEKLKLKLHPEKTKVVNLSWGKQGFKFLGHTLRKAASYRYKGKYFLNRWPCPESLKAVRQRIKGITGRSRFGVKNVRELVPDLNRALQGWGNYYKNGNANKAFGRIDNYVWYRLALFENRRRKRKRPHRFREFGYDWYRSLGVYNLVGTVQYPNLALVNARTPKDFW